MEIQMEEWVVSLKRKNKLNELETQTPTPPPSVLTASQTQSETTTTTSKTDLQMGFGLGVLGSGLAVLFWNVLLKRRSASAGKSNLPKLKKNTELEKSFVEGMHVEVSRNKEGFGNALFIAIITEEVGENKFLVEYQTLRKENENKLLIEEVDAVQIRPTPPHENLERGGFGRLEKVDAFYNAGWWAGVIFEVHGDSRYSVCLSENCEEFKFEHWQLRLHQEWINGKWVTAFKA